MGFAKGLVEFLKEGGVVATLDSLRTLGEYLRNNPDERSKAVREKVDKMVETVPEGAESFEPSPDAVKELKNEVCSILQEQASPVYAYYVVLFSELPLDNGEEELLKKILTNIDSECELWGDDERKNKYQEDVDDFMCDHIGGGLKWGDDCFVNGRSIIINFDRFDALDNKVYCEDEIRKLADALNHLLDDTYITGFSIS